MRGEEILRNIIQAITGCVIEKYRERREGRKKQRKKRQKERERERREERREREERDERGRKKERNRGRECLGWDTLGYNPRIGTRAGFERPNNVQEWDEKERKKWREREKQKGMRKEERKK